jgi:ribose transport system substrate-binding protein
MRHRINPGSRAWMAVPLAALSLAAAGCGSSSSSSASASPGAASRVVSATPPSSGCGSITLPTTSDPDGVLASLPASAGSLFRGWDTVLKSAWAGWKPSHQPPYKVAILLGPFVNGFNPEFEKLLESQLQASSSEGKSRGRICRVNSYARRRIHMYPGKCRHSRESYARRPTAT